MSGQKKNPKKQPITKKQATKSMYLIGIGVVLVVAGLVVLVAGYLPSSGNNSSAGWTPMYFGVLDSSISDEEKEEYVRGFIAQNEGISESCEIAHFYNFDCGACQRLEPWLIGFKAAYPEIQITSYELHESGSRPKFEAMKKEYGLSSASVPIVFICGSVLEGVHTIQTNLEPMALAVYDIESRQDTQVQIEPLSISLT